MLESGSGPSTNIAAVGHLGFLFYRYCISSVTSGDIFSNLCIWIRLNPFMCLRKYGRHILEIATSHLLNTMKILFSHFLQDHTSVVFFSKLIRDILQVIWLCTPEFGPGLSTNMTGVGHIGFSRYRISSVTSGRILSKLMKTIQSVNLHGCHLKNHDFPFT